MNTIVAVNYFEHILKTSLVKLSAICSIVRAYLFFSAAARGIAAEILRSHRRRD